MKKNVTKNDLVDSIAKNVDCERKVIQAVVDSFLEEVKHSLAKGNTIELRGFGTFSNKLRNGRISARNPKTGEKITEPIAPHYVAAFKSGKELSEALSKLKVTADEKK